MLRRPGFSGIDPRAGVAMKGDGGGSSSSSSTTQQDQRVAATDNAIAIGSGGSLTISNPEGFRDLLLAGAGFFEGALEALEKTSDASERNFSKVLEFAGERAKDAETAFGAAREVIAETGRSEEQNLGLQVLKSAGPIILVAGIAAAVIFASK